MSLASTFQSAIKRAVERITEEIQKHAQTSRAYRGNELRRSIKIIRSGEYARSVLADKSYAKYVEYGNNQKGAYIYPVSAKALHFWINGNEIFAKRVRTYSGRYFMRSAAEHGRRVAKRIIREEI